MLYRFFHFSPSAKRNSLLWLVIFLSLFSLALWLFSIHQKTYAHVPEASPTLGSSKGENINTARKIAPNIQFLDDNGKITSLESFRGQAVLLNFWASWCRYCTSELNSLINLERRLVQAGIPAKILFINVDTNNDGKNLIRRDKLPIAFFHDPFSNTVGAFGSSMLPTTVLIDANGRIVETFYGEKKWDDDKFVHIISAVARE